MDIPSFVLPDDQFPADFSVFTSSDGTALKLYIGTTTGSLVQATFQAGGSWSTCSVKKLFKKPIRNVKQVGDFTFISTSSGKMLILKDGESYIKMKTFQDEEGEPLEISSICPLNSSEELSNNSTDILVAIGDEYGNVYIFKIFPDLKSWEQVYVSQEQDDSITDLIYHPYKKTLIASSGDGTFVVIDTKKLKLVAHSSSLDDEILSLALDKDFNVICSTGLGALVSYKWGYWGKVSSRLKPKFHASAPINCIQFHDYDTPYLITGTNEGIVRKVLTGSELSVKTLLWTFDDSVESLKIVKVNEIAFVAASLTNDNRVYFLSLEANSVKSIPEDDFGVTENSAKKTKKQKIADSSFQSRTSAHLDSFFQDLD